MFTTSPLQAPGGFDLQCLTRCEVTCAILASNYTWVYGSCRGCDGNEIPLFWKQPSTSWESLRSRRSCCISHRRKTFHATVHFMTSARRQTVCAVLGFWSCRLCNSRLFASLSGMRRGAIQGEVDYNIANFELKKREAHLEIAQLDSRFDGRVLQSPTVRLV
jgi:hypothetical protein